jgi:hypothetical protein
MLSLADDNGVVTATEAQLMDALAIDMVKEELVRQARLTIGDNKAGAISTMNHTRVE